MHLTDWFLDAERVDFIEGETYIIKAYDKQNKSRWASLLVTAKEYNEEKRYRDFKIETVLDGSDDVMEVAKETRGWEE